jgi:DNA repair protein SbcC/Rad50
MSFRLKSLTVENFRSIRGRISVSLDAPIVLIHGPNGVGKTSLLSAIELGLTGAIPTLSGGDDGYLKHLPHKDSPNGQGRVLLNATDGALTFDSEVTLTGTGIEGGGLLNADQTRFFSERCYLAQSTLGRLLEIYQHQDARRSDSPLTRFVKELLGLDPLDALIDGLHSSGDVRRLRTVAPLFWTGRTDLPAVERDAKDAETREAALEADVKDREANVRSLAGDLHPADVPIDADLLGSTLSASLEDGERAMVELTRRKRELQAAAQQIQLSAATDAGAERRAIEAAHVAARAALAAWTEGDGGRLDKLVQTVQAAFPDVPAVVNGSGAAHRAALTAVTAERDRLSALVASDTADAASLADVAASVRQGQARIAQIDRELADLAGLNQELAQALAAVATHIHDENCPVCGRDFAEVSEQPLAAHVSERVAELVEAAGRLQTLARDRTTTATAVAEAERRSQLLSSRALPAERLAELKLEIARLQEWATELVSLAEAAADGDPLQATAATTARRLAELNSRDSAVSGQREQLVALARDLALPAPGADQPLEAAAAALLVALGEREAALTARQARYLQAQDELSELETSRAALEIAASAALARREELDALSAAKAEADRRIDVARSLADEARGARTAIVRKVFNDELNAIWRDLFIRLAPEEAFVPAFALPASSSGPVEAVLETIYRDGGRGGDPRAMLSAGNLNTAALTLFLALHLSVAPTLPLLMIDDPVQSMDEVHIAQFAALLRTLKGADRQVIIAVHERALFEYLSLELSPAFNGDRLMTIELGRGPDGQTVAPWDTKTYKVDGAIAA